MRSTLTFAFLLCTILTSLAQTAALKGQLQDAENQAISYANVALYATADSSLFKVEVSDDAGIFHMKGLQAGAYFLQASYVGLPDLTRTAIALEEGQTLDLGVLSFSPAGVDLAEATVKASRAMVEIKPDRTVFNVQGTINSTGSDAISLLRKAPGVTVDNNDNINMLGRSGVLLYVDGKRLPLTGDDLTGYLQNLPADQIDRIDIITSPGARYEAEGNAGIIDIRMKRDKNLGTNGSVSGTFSHGRHARYNGSASANYRSKRFNTFAMVGAGKRDGFNDLSFETDQNGFHLSEIIDLRHKSEYYNYRLGTDFFIDQQHTVGFLIGGNRADNSRTNLDRIELSNQNTPSQIDSILIADDITTGDRTNQTYNLNYRFDNRKGRTLNIDLDYGNFKSTRDRDQPNRYYDASETTLLSEVIDAYDMGSDIDIYTAKLDFEEELLGGKLGVGSKLSQVKSDNDFFVFDATSGHRIQDNERSNVFAYDEMVYAGYLSFSRPINDKWSAYAGIRAEQTDITGTLTAFKADLQQDPVELNYLSWFPSAGLTYQMAPKHSFALNYGRRINRPDYSVLNPFNNRLSELSYQKGNPNLRPEIVNNYELGYTMNYRYNFKLAYSKTVDQITRIIGPDDFDPRAGFITWENLAVQHVYSLNVSAPVQVAKKWNAYFNLSASYLDNQANYGGNAIVDVQAFTYNIYQQHTFDLPAGFKGEISGWYSGPGIWGGVFEYDPSWSLNVGLQKRFLQDRLNVRLSFDDIFFETGWSGFSRFNGMYSEGRGNWDSRRGAISVSYNFGNQNVKSRKRKTGMEDEAGRVGDG